MNQHVVVCGLGNVGYRCFDLLRRLGQPLAVICKQAPSEWIREVQEAGGICVEGDASDTRMLEQAGIRNARAVITATDNDLTNISIAMDARSMNPNIRIIARLFNQDLAQQIKSPLGIAQTFSTSSLAAPVFAAAALGEKIVGYFDIEGQSFVIGEVDRKADPAAAHPDGDLLLQAHDGRLVPVSPANGAAPPAGPLLSIGPADHSSGLVPEQVMEARRRSAPRRIPRSLRAFWESTPAVIRGLLAGMTILIASSVAVFHYGMSLPWTTAAYFAVTIVTTVGFGDIHLSSAPSLIKIYGCVLMLCGPALLAVMISLLGDFLVSTRLSSLLHGHHCDEDSHHILISAGHITYRVADALRSANEKTAALVAADEGKAGLISPHMVCIRGDPRLPESLIRAGVRTARSIVALGDDDLTNLGAVLAAREINPGIRTVARVFDSNLAAKLKNQLKLDGVFSISAVSAPTFVAAALFPEVIQGLAWRDRLIVIARSHAGHGSANAAEIELVLAPSGAHRQLQPLAPGTPLAPGQKAIRILCLPLA